jgi:hypothetical protein
MWFMKSYGGLAHVRGISSSELAVARKNGVHDKHTCIYQDMYPPELKLKRANE